MEPINQGPMQLRVVQSVSTEQSDAHSQNERTAHAKWDDAVETGDYSPDDFYVHKNPGEDSHHVRFNLGADHYAMISRIVSKDSWPEYASVTDFMRDAVYHRLQYLNNSSRETPSVLAEIMRLSRAENNSRLTLAMLQQAKTTLDIFDEAAQATIDANDLTGLRRLVEDHWKIVECFPLERRNEMYDLLVKYSRVAGVPVPDRTPDAPGDDLPPANYDPEH